MHKLKKNLFLILLPQAFCLAFGLWIHFRLVIASAKFASGSDARVEASSQSAGTTPTDLAGKRPSAEFVAAESPTYSFTANHVISSMPVAGMITFVWIAALQSIAAYLVLARCKTKNSRERRQYDRNALQQTNDLVRTRNAIIFGLAKLADSRDPETGHHLERISLFATRLTAALRRHPQYRERLTPAFIQSIGISSVLHDIGKVALPDSILLKPGALTDEERHRMKHHTTIASNCLMEIDHRLGSSSFLEMAREIANYHHEHWDGRGYPHGLQGEQIPLAARIVAIADVYDALSVRRVYKKAFPHEQCVQMICENAGRQFDPTIVDVFLGIESQFREIAARFAQSTDTQHPPIPERSMTGNRLTREQEKALTLVLHPIDEKLANEKLVAETA